MKYLRNEQGYGNMPMSRNIGLRSARGQIIAYLDDDAYAEPQWLEEIVAAYDDENVGAVGGRAINGQPGESSKGVYEIGKILPNGLITQNFSADPGKIVDVDIILGCNMSFRREVLARLGGFREHYTATCNCEETDMCSRVKKLGYSIRFNPKACVEHVGAPQAKGRRMDLRYDIFGCRNYMMYLAINYGIFSRFFYLAIGYLLYSSAKDFVRKAGGAGLSMICRLIGVLSGLCMGLFLRSTHGSARKGMIRRARKSGACFCYVSYCVRECGNELIWNVLPNFQSPLTMTNVISNAAYLLPEHANRVLLAYLGRGGCHGIMQHARNFLDLGHRVSVLTIIATTNLCGR